MPDDDNTSPSDPETEAMRAGAEVEQGAASDEGEHHPRTHPVDLPPRAADGVTDTDAESAIGAD